MTITLRPALPEDEPFLFDLYASTRREEITAWGLPPEQQRALLELQFRAQRQHYAAMIERPDHQIVMVDGREAGRLLVGRGEREILLADIALLPEARNRGIGGRLIGGLLDEAAATGCEVCLHVLKTNPAARLYERLGFAVTGDDGMYLEMRWRPERAE